MTQATPSLDSTQYTRPSILQYERIYGHNFISPGGLDSTRETVKRLNLQAGMNVLDVGSGLGGAAFYMAQEYGVRVHGLDVARNMVTLALERLQQLELKLQTLVSFAHSDILESHFDSEFNVVYSRDAFLHIHDKPRLFHTLHRALKPNGQLFFTDYCRGEGELSEEFLAYVAARGYDLHPPAAYSKLIEQAGFTDVVALDKTALFGEYLKRELERFLENNPMSHAGEMAEVRRSWEEKLARNQRGEQGWGWFWGKKR